MTNIANVTNSAGKTASQLTVQSLGRDQVLGFAPGDWIEILNDITEFKQTCGELHKIDTIDVAPKTITLADSVIDGTAFPTGPLDGSLHTRIRRWDQSGKVYEQDGTTAWWDIDAEGSADIPVPPSGTSLILENGITVSFDQGSATGAFNTGDFWTFAARTATGQVEQLDKAAPRGIHHHYARLAIVTFPSTATDCRTEWPPSTAQSDCGCCTYTVGDGVNTLASTPRSMTPLTRCRRTREAKSVSYLGSTPRTFSSKAAATWFFGAAGGRHALLRQKPGRGQAPTARRSLRSSPSRDRSMYSYSPSPWKRRKIKLACSSMERAS